MVKIEPVISHEKKTGICPFGNSDPPVRITLLCNGNAERPGLTHLILFVIIIKRLLFRPPKDLWKVPCVIFQI
jgi:hypothetical protein